MRQARTRGAMFCSFAKGINDIPTAAIGPKALFPRLQQQYDNSLTRIRTSLNIYTARQPGAMDAVATCRVCRF